MSSKRSRLKQVNYEESSESENEDESPKKKRRLPVINKAKTLRNADATACASVTATNGGKDDGSSSDSEVLANITRKRDGIKNLCLSDDSDSDSSVDNYLKPADAIDLNSLVSDSKQLLANTNNIDRKSTAEEIGTLSDSEDSDNNEEVDDQNTGFENFEKFQEVQKFEKELQEAQEKMKSIGPWTTTLASKDTATVSDLLKLGEIDVPNDQPNQSVESSDDEEFEELEEVPSQKMENPGIPRDGLEITLNDPRLVEKKTKQNDIMMMIKRKINRVKKENQISAHKVHCLCWIAHGMSVNRVLNNQELLKSLLKLLPSENVYPDGRVTLKYIEQLVNWFRKQVKINESDSTLKLPLLKSLLDIVTKKSASKKELVLIFVALLRAIGLSCRLVLSFNVVPLRPPQSELCSLATKPKDDGKDEQKIESGKNAKKSGKNVVKSAFFVEASTSKVVDKAENDRVVEKKLKNSGNKVKKEVVKKITNGEGLEENEKIKSVKTRAKQSNKPTVKSEAAETVNKKETKPSDYMNGKDSTNNNNTKKPNKTPPKPAVKRPGSRSSARLKNDKKIGQIDGFTNTIDYLTDSDEICDTKFVKKLKLDFQNENVNFEKIYDFECSSEINEDHFQDQLFIPQLDGGRRLVKKPTKNEASSSKPTPTTRPSRMTKVDKLKQYTEAANDVDSSDEEAFEEKSPFFNNAQTSTLKVVDKSTAKVKSIPKNKAESSKDIENSKSSRAKSANVLKVPRQTRSKSDGNRNDTETPAEKTTKTTSKDEKPKSISRSKSAATPRTVKSSSNTKQSNKSIKSDIIDIIKKGISEDKLKNHKRANKSSMSKLKSDSDSDYMPDEENEKVTPKRKKHTSESDFEEKQNKSIRKSHKRKKPVRENDRRVLSSDSEGEDKVVVRKGNDVWLEIFVEEEEKWISVDLLNGQIHCVQSLYNRASQPVRYIVAFNNNGTLKDVTNRYCKNWNTVTRKLRVDNTWWTSTLKPYIGTPTARDREEDRDLSRLQLEQPLPTTITEYKDHPLYALKRHLLKFQALYPPDAPTLGFIRGEAVYSRDCVHTLHSRETWVKEAKVVKPGEIAYKIVKARPKYDRLSGKCITDIPLEIFGPWQVKDYEPPEAKDGKVPRNAYGNVDLFKECMLPGGTVLLKLPGLNKIARKLGIDCAQAVVGFDFHGGSSHPVVDGYVVCKEYEQTMIDAWRQEQIEIEKREREKIDKRVYGNWRRLIRGLIIREKLKLKYGFGVNEDGDGEEEKKDEPKVKPKRPKFLIKPKNTAVATCVGKRKNPRKVVSDDEDN